MVQGFNGLGDLLVQSFAPLLEHCAVGDLLRERVLKNVLDFGKGGLFVEKLFVLKGSKEAIQFIFGLGDHLAKQTHRELATDDRKLLEQRFLFRSEPVDTGSEDTLHGRGQNLKVGSTHPPL
jgi:hypothetical protein